jgi:hypothetical protein
VTAVLTLPVGASVRDRECDQDLKGTLVMDEHSVRTKFRFMLIYKTELTHVSRQDPNDSRTVFTCQLVEIA